MRCVGIKDGSDPTACCRVDCKFPGPGSVKCEVFLSLSFLLTTRPSPLQASPDADGKGGLVLAMDLVVDDAYLMFACSIVGRIASEAELFVVESASAEAQACSLLGRAADALRRGES